MRMTKVKLIPPDGGWGWMVVFGSAIACMMNVPFLQLFGLLYGKHLEKLGANTSDASLVGSIMLFILNFGGPLTGSFIKRTSPRVACATGCALVSSGVFLSGFSTSILHMILTYGLLCGLGIGLIQTASFVSVNSYFKLKRSRAVGVSVAGSGVGQLFMPQLTRYLQDAYGFTGTCILLGAVSLNGLIGCAFLQPVEWHMREVKGKEEEVKLLNGGHKPPPATNLTTKSRRLTEPDLNKRIMNNNKTDSQSCKELHRREFYEALPNSFQIDETKETSSERSKPRKKSIFKKIADYFGFHLLANFRLVNTIVANALGIASLQNFALLYPFFLKYSVGLDARHTATCMSATAGADLIGRLTLPSLADKYKLTAKVSIVITSVWLIITRQYLSFQTSFSSLVVASILYGLGRSMFIVSQNIAISDTIKDPEQVPLGLGLGLLMKGVWVMPVTLFLGWIRDYTESYVISMTAQNVLLLILVIAWTPEIIYDNYRNKPSKDLEGS